uniref:Uncharacterized protein n=1 Tax=Romanomermis culicivorax TaxID=13658 RepID=A0A915JS72_ROMCU
MLIFSPKSKYRTKVPKNTLQQLIWNDCLRERVVNNKKNAHRTELYFKLNTLGNNFDGLMQNPEFSLRFVRIDVMNIVSKADSLLLKKYWKLKNYNLKPLDTLIQ